ncbi:MAG: hypothetical protein ACJAS9_000973 [Polaribacter sp.]|jgi:hypothetical protein
MKLLISICLVVSFSVTGSVNAEDFNPEQFA